MDFMCPILVCFRYADLSLNRESNYRFSYNKMLALNGNTAPYMLYAYARIQVGYAYMSRYRVGYAYMSTCRVGYAYMFRMQGRGVVMSWNFVLLEALFPGLQRRSVCLVL